MISRTAACFLGLLFLSSCGEPAGPLGGLRWALVTVDETVLPARQAAHTYLIVADTLEFGLESSMWKARPLARGRRVVRYADGTRGTDEWWYTYDNHAVSPFAIRALCADGDALASCVDGNATATVDGSSLSIRFREVSLGTLRYRLIV